MLKTAYVMLISSFQKCLSPEQFSVILESIRQNIDKQKERSRDTHLRQEIIKDDIVELEQRTLEAIRETKPIDYEDKIDKLNNTINSLQSSINALSFNQIPAIQSKEEHEKLTRSISDPAITSQVEGFDLQQEVFSTPISSPEKKESVIYDHDFDSKLNPYEDLFKEYRYAKPTFLLNHYAKKIKKNELTKDVVKEELGMVIQSTQTNSQKIGGQTARVVKGSEDYNELKIKVEFLKLYRDTLKTMRSGIDNISFCGKGMYVNYDQMIERLYILLEHKQGGNNSDLLKNEANDIIDMLLQIIL